MKLVLITLDMFFFWYYQKSLMNHRSKVFFTMFICSLLLFSFASVEGTYTTITVSDHIETPLPSIETKMEEENEILPTPQVGTDFSDAIAIPMTKTGNVRKGSVEFQLNSTAPYLFFKFDINESSPVSVTVDAATGTSIDESQYEVVYDVFQGSGFEDWVEFKSTRDYDLPMKTDYPAEKIGDHYISVSAVDLTDFEFGTGEFVELNITIQHYEAGAVRENEKTSLVQSDPINIISQIQKYLTSNGFMNLENASVNLGEMTPQDPDYAKVIGLSVYGLLKSAEIIVKTNNSNETQINDNIAKYVNLAYQLYKSAEDAMLEPVSRLFFYRPSESNVAGQDFVTYLRDNIYLVVAMNEINWFITSFSLQGVVPFDSVALNALKTTIVQRITAMFKQGQGDYRERLTITDYAEDGNTNVFDINDYGSIVVSETNSLESYALLAETFFWEGNTAEMDDIVSYVSSNMNITKVLGMNIHPAGLLASSYNTGTSQPSDEVDLIGNSFFVSHLNTYAKQGVSSNGLGKNATETLALASDLMENILKVFSSDDSSSPLLYSKVNTTDTSQNEKIIRNIDNVAAIFAINRLAVNWETYNPGLSGKAIKRSWKIRSLSGLNALHNQFFDQREQFYFGYWDDLGRKFDVDNNEIDKNIFLANTFVATVLIDMFPVEMLVIEQPNLPVGSEAQVTLGVNLLNADGTWIWWDPFKPFSFDIKVSIPDFNYIKTQEVLLDAFNAQQSLFVPFTYQVQKRGTYDVIIELSTEGLTLLRQTLEFRAIGNARAEFPLQSFSISDTSFETDITLIDETGSVLSSLQVSASLGLPFEDSTSAFNQKYIRSGRTDTSGRLRLTFSVSDLSKDKLINLTKLYSQDPIPPFVEIPLYLNITNFESFDLAQRIIVVPVRILLNRVNLRVSPATLELTQGTTEAFTFSVTALDQQQNPIKDAAIHYQIKELPGIKNTVFTDLDGEATITLRDSELFALSNLAILSNQGKITSDLKAINVTIEMTLNSSLYPVRTIQRPLTVNPNSLIITANPVQLSVKEANIVQQSIPPISVDVSVSDLFSRVVNALVSITWADEKVNEIIPLDPEKKHLSPYTFSVDVSKLPAGNYTLMIIAEKDGITSTVEIETMNPGLHLNQQPQISKPVVALRNIVIETSTVEDIVISLVSVLSALLFAQGANLLWDYSFNLLGMKRKCPHCDEFISRKNKVCSHCGRDVKPVQEEAEQNKQSDQPQTIEETDEQPAKEL